MSEIFVSRRIPFRFLRRLTWFSLCILGRAKTDSVFGEIRFRSKGIDGHVVDSDSNPQIWEGYADHVQSGCETTLLTLPASSKGPSQHQREMFLELRERFHDLFPTIVERFSTLIPEVERRTAARVFDLESNLRLRQITLENDVDYPERFKKQDLELVFGLEKTALSWSLSFQNWNPVATEIWDMAYQDSAALLVPSANDEWPDYRWAEHRVAAFQLDDETRVSISLTWPSADNPVLEFDIYWKDENIQNRCLIEDKFGEPTDGIGVAFGTNPNHVAIYSGHSDRILLLGDLSSNEFMSVNRMSSDVTSNWNDVVSDVVKNNPELHIDNEHK